MDWTGNKHSVYVTIGADKTNNPERENNDYYATDPKAITELLKVTSFDKNIWEPACGEGHLSKALEAEGYNVRSTDLIDRGYGQGGIDFLKQTEPFMGDIITNPPYKYATEFVEKALELIPEGNRVAMFLKIQFLEGQKRGIIFDNTPPYKVYVARKRLVCAKNGNFEGVKNGVQCYAWFVWEKGFCGSTEIEWINTD